MITKASPILSAVSSSIGVDEVDETVVLPGEDVVDVELCFVDDKFVEEVDIYVVVELTVDDSFEELIDELDFDVSDDDDDVDSKDDVELIVDDSVDELIVELDFDLSDDDDDVGSEEEVELIVDDALEGLDVELAFDVSDEEDEDVP